MSDIVGIMDMDGFVIEKKFFCKELGLLKVGNNMVRSYFFDLGIRWSDLSEKDKRSSLYLIRHIHKLPFGVPDGVRAYNLSALNGIIIKFYYEARRSRDSVIAYKGGNFEKDVLARLGIPSVNLERFGCPKAEELMTDLIWLETCGKHVVKDAYLHCPKVEVEAYAQWMEKL